MLINSHVLNGKRQTKHALTKEIWDDLLAAEQLFNENGEVFSVVKLSNFFDVPMSTASRWHFALTHRHLILGDSVNPLW